MDAIRFGTDGWRGTLDVVTNERVRMVGQAIATYLDDQGPTGPVAVGYDARESSPRFADELADVIAANGREVLMPRRDIPTPVVAWTVVDQSLAGGVVVTASHNPPEYNGIKFIPADGAPALPETTDAIEARLRSPTGNGTGVIRETDFINPYLRHVTSRINGDFSGLTVAYDAMHGSGRGVTDALLERGGADVIRLRCDRDPTFGGTPPEPSEHHLETLRKTTKETDLGIANDGDADRIAIVTPRGYLDENRFFAALYEYLLEADSGPAVRTVSTSSLIDRVGRRHGEEIIETPVGFKWVAAAMADHDALVGGEESGGFSIREHVREKDGVLMAGVAAQMTVEQPLETRVDTLLRDHGPIHQDKTSVDCPEEEKTRVLSWLNQAHPSKIGGEPIDRVNDADGIKFFLADGSWLLVRPSGTEPKLRLYAEAESIDRVEELLDAGRSLLAQRE